MKCFNCNSEIADNNLFCPLCGATLALDNNVIENNDNVHANTIVEPVKNVQPVSNNINNISGQNDVSMDVNLDMNSNNNFNIGVMEPKTNEINGKSKTPIVIASVLIVIVLAVVGVCGYIFMNSPKKTFVSVFDKTYEFLFNSIDSKMYTSDTLSLDFDLKTTNKIVDEDMGPIFNIIKNITLSGKSQIDYKNKNMLIDLDSKYNNNELLNAGLYISNEKLYFDLYDLYDKKLTYDIEGVNEIFKVNEYSKDVINVVDEVKNVITASLKNEYFKSEKVKMNVNGKEASVDKTILLLNYSNLKVLLNDVLTNFKSNESFLNSLVNFMKFEEMSKQDLIDEIDDMLVEINEETDIPEGDIKIILYTKSFNKNFVGFAIEDNTSDYGEDFSMINDKENEFTVKYFDGYDEYSAVIKVDGDVYTLVIDEEYGKIEVGLNIKTFDYSYKSVEDEEMMTTSLTTDKDGKKHLSILYEMEGNEIGIDISYVTKYNESVIIPTLTPSIDIESITDEDGMNILNKLQEKQGVKDLMSEIEKVSFPLKQQQLCASAFGCDCDDNAATCTCNYINENGDVASDTIECDNPNYQNCPSGVNCVQTDDYNIYNETLNKAKESAFKTYAARVLSNATEEYVIDKLTNTSLNVKYYDIATLLGTDTYFGCVKVLGDEEDYDYSLILYDADNKLKIEGFSDYSYLSQNDVVVEWSYSDNFSSYDYSDSTCGSSFLKQKLDSFNKYSTGVNKLS